MTGKIIDPVYKNLFGVMSERFFHAFGRQREQELLIKKWEKYDLWVATKKKLVPDYILKEKGTRKRVLFRGYKRSVLEQLNSKLLHYKYLCRTIDNEMNVLAFFNRCKNDETLKQKIYNLLLNASPEICGQYSLLVKEFKDP